VTTRTFELVASADRPLPPNALAKLRGQESKKPYARQHRASFSVR
jgi:hypothetical protein